MEPNTVLLFCSTRSKGGDFVWEQTLNPTSVGDSAENWAIPLINGLKAHNVDVHLNDFSLAYHNPTYPIALIGPARLNKEWSLANPTILGPLHFDNPKDQLSNSIKLTESLKDSRILSYLISAEWVYDLVKLAVGDRCHQWYAGIDLAAHKDSRYDPKSIDVLVYDNLRWEREQHHLTLLQPILQRLALRDMRVRVVNQDDLNTQRYAKLLSQSRTLLFLSEFEAQGLAYQQAMAKNVPVLAWKPTRWEPKQELSPTVSTVPYFSAECGETFRNMGDFSIAFERFWSKLDQYEPRRYVSQNLTIAQSVKMFINVYQRAFATIAAS